MNQDLLTRIQMLEELANALEPTPALRQHWNKKTQRFADEFYDNLEKMPPYVRTEKQGRRHQRLPFR